ncbi:integrin alpha-D-like [Platysternon megacephalum]|uniref:Integrin alpha-D-like n=1 Tax=Platysternon megacephalum TaxID=55544 RepID=A0A4D9DVB0_9SAUR|nr:integrin alpha-D-like [Platysternon megacephalum]
MLDPKRQNIFIDRETFHATMKSWIATCYHDCILDDEADENRSSKRNMRKNRGSTSFLSDEDYETFQETAEDMIFDSLTSNVEDLKYRNRKLNVQIQGMQKAMKVLDETCLQLTDEIAELKSRLTSMHQPLENLKYVSNELDDIRSKTMNLCEENHVVRGCCRRPNSKAQEEKKSAVYEVLSVEDAWEYLQDFLQEIKSQKNSMFLALTDEIALKEQLSHSLLSVIRMLACLRPFIENWNKVIKRLKTTFLECLELSTKSTSIQDPELQKVLLEESDETKKQSEQNTAEAESHTTTNSVRKKSGP